MQSRDQSSTETIGWASCIWWRL